MNKTERIMLGLGFMFYIVTVSIIAAVSTVLAVNTVADILGGFYVG